MKTKHGFTLIEVILAVAIAAISFTILGHLASSLKLFGLAQTETQAAGVARTYIDLVRSNWANDESYTNTVLPSYQPPKGFSYDVKVQNAISNETLLAYTYGTNPTGLLEDYSKLRNLLVTVTNAQGRKITLSTQISRSRVK